MEEFVSIEKLATAIKRKLGRATTQTKIIVLYAFNATGKTRLTGLLNDTEGECLKVLCYNPFLEDMFRWDNDNYILTFSPNSWFVELVNEQGLEKDIIDNFKSIVSSKIEPLFDFKAGKVTFSVPTGGDSSVNNIKISKGEESMLIWSIFYTILETAADALDTDEANRTTQVFNGLQYIIIDDPVSSIDDTKIITMAVKLIETIKLLKNSTVKILITTHHALFYNVAVSSLKKVKRKNKNIFRSFSLSQNNYTYKLSGQSEAPFSYHLSVKKMIQDAISGDSLERYHFNLFRNLLEKTANFLGYNDWVDCVVGDKRQEFIKLLNLYSHSRLSDLESREISFQDKTIFQETFNDFNANFKWKQ